MRHPASTVRPAANPAPPRLRHLPGLAVCLLLALAALEIGRSGWLSSRGFSALTVAIVLGMAVGNLAPPAWLAGAVPGVTFAKQTLLRAGVVLYGVKLTFQDIGQVGVAGVIIDALVLTSTFAVAWFAGTRLLRLDNHTALLIGAGSSICGAAAVLATEPVLRSESNKVTVAISTVVVFGTLAIFLYPALYRHGVLDAVVPQGVHAFGVYEGSTIQEVAQVVAAAHGIGERATDAAVIAKMVRVMMLAPFLIGLSAWIARVRPAAVERPGATRLAMPWFAFLFIGVVVANSLVAWPAAALSTANDVDMVLLGMAMSALGMTTRVQSIRDAGLRPLLLGAMLWAWLVVGGALINGAVARLL